MKRSIELRQKRAAIYEQVKAILNKAADERRSLDSGEQESIGRMEAEMEALRKTYEAEERAEQIERELAAAPGQEQQRSEGGTGINSAEYRSALWDGYARSGERRADMSVGVSADGGYLVPTDFEAQVITGLTQENVMRQLGTVRTYQHDRDIPVKSTRAVFGWVAEKGAYPTAAPAYGKASLKAHKIGGIIQVSEELLTDSAVGIEAEVRDEIIYAAGRCEEAAFVAGTGSGQPTGFLETAQTGVTTAVANAITFDEVIDLFHSLAPGYRRNATWLMNDAVAKVIRKLKATDGAIGSLEYLWQPSLTAGAPDTILGRPVRYSQDMDSDVTAGKKVMAFGDFSYYHIGDRVGLTIQRLNELYAGTGQVGFRATRRVDGLLTLAEAVKLMVMHA